MNKINQTLDYISSLIVDQFIEVDGLINVEEFANDFASIKHNNNPPNTDSWQSTQDHNYERGWQLATFINNQIKENNNV